MASPSDMMTSIETWAFRPAFENSWISEAFAHDTEALTKALQKSISTDPTQNVDVSPSVSTFSDLYSIPSSETPRSQSVTTSGGGGGSEPETASKRFRTAAPRSGVVPPSGKITKRKSRASKRSPTTFIQADPANFRQMVQQVTGVRFTAGPNPVGSVLKPEPQRVVNRLQAGCLLPTLDTSAFLLDHHQQQVMVGPSAAATVAGQGSLGFGPPVVESGPGFDFDGFSNFPTLESWKVM